MASFEWNGTTVKLKPATARNRLRLARLRSKVGWYDMKDGDDKDDMETALNLLYLVESVDGNFGFPVPTNGNATPDILTEYVEGVLGAHENLFVRWANALYSTRQETGNEPDLLPPNELSEDQKKTKKSKKKD